LLKQIGNKVNYKKIIKGEKTVKKNELFKDNENIQEIIFVKILY
jgi:hypothetical protein